MHSNNITICSNCHHEFNATRSHQGYSICPRCQETVPVGLGATEVAGLAVLGALDSMRNTPAHAKRLAFVATWAMDEVLREGTEALANMDLPALDDAALDAMLLLEAYFAERGTAATAAAIEAFQRAQADRKRTPAPAGFLARVREVAASPAAHRELVTSALSRPKSRRLVEAADAAWGAKNPNPADK